MQPLNAKGLVQYQNKWSAGGVRQPAVGHSSPGPSPKRKLLDQVRLAIRARHYSPRTEEAYVGWIKRFIFFHGKRHPGEMGAAEITQFLTSLAVRS